MEIQRVVKSLINTAKDSINSKSYYAALGVLLMIPEIINQSNDSGIYINWCDKYIQEIDGFSGDVLYKLKKELFFGNNKSNSYSTPNIKIYEVNGNKTRFCFDTRDNNKQWKTYASDINDFLKNFIDSLEKYLLKEAA